MFDNGGGGDVGGGDVGGGDGGGGGGEVSAILVARAYHNIAITGLFVPYAMIHEQ